MPAKCRETQKLITQSRISGVSMVTSDTQSQSDKFKALARELDADEDEAPWDERLAKVAKQKLETPDDPER